MSDAEWAPLSEIENRGLWSETVRVIRKAVKNARRVKKINHDKHNACNFN